MGLEKRLNLCSFLENGYVVKNYAYKITFIVLIFSLKLTLIKRLFFCVVDLILSEKDNFLMLKACGETKCWKDHKISKNQDF